MRRNLLTLLLLFTTYMGAQSVKGLISDFETGEPIPGANVILKGTNFGTASDLNGKFELSGIEQGVYTLRVSFIGYNDYTEEVLISLSTLFLEIKLTQKEIAIDQVVVTGSRTEKKRSESPVVVNLLDAKVFTKTNSNTLSEGLNFQPGVRVEIDCQTCNYSQVRLNGMGGSYSQILINSRPIFSSLNGLYGLEQIPANMIDRVEVVRGGGSALYGSSAVGGVINIITSEPTESSWGVNFDNELIDGRTPDRNLMVNSTMINDGRNLGISLFGVFRDRKAYDHNGDGYSELPLLKNNSFGLKGHYNPGSYSRLNLDLHSIYEERRGGNEIGLPAHKADQSEQRTHNIFGGGLAYEYFIPNSNTDFSAYISGQVLDRVHYTGIDHVDAYGTSKNETTITGFQINSGVTDFLGTDENRFTAGIEYKYDNIHDHIPGYDYYIDQLTREIGLFLQSDWKINPVITLLAGVRIDNHSAVENPVINPRLNLLYNFTPELQGRLSYSTGFRAPAAFDSDLHIAFAGGGISRISLDPNLKMEKSYSLSTSLDFNHAHKFYIFGVTLEGFYTRLFDTFVLEEESIPGSENINLIKRNGGESYVAGTTFEFRYSNTKSWDFTTGLTYQQSIYQNAVFWSENAPGETDYLRSPELYGFYNLSFPLISDLMISLSGIYTGPMKVPHLAGAPGISEDALLNTDSFFEQNVKLSYNLTALNLPNKITVYTGIKNLFNAYQNNFDVGKNRDSNFIYGPAKPGTIFFGFNFGV